MSIGLIAFDLDGTLLDEKKRISEQNLKALQVAADNGIYLVPCTARLFQTIPQEVRELPFIRYAITVNGAEVYDRDRDCAVCRAEIPAEEAEMLYDYMDKLPVIYDCYQQGRGWIDQHFYDNAEKLISDEYTLRLIRGMRTPVDNFRKTMRERKLPIQKTQMFFAETQNKLLYAVTGKTAAEIIISRADHTQPNINLTSWKGQIVRKQDIYTAKNYLNHDEIDTLNRLVVLFLESAELRAKNRQDLTIQFWRDNIDKILDFQDKKVLTNAGSISNAEMEKQVNRIYELFDQRRKIESTQKADDEDLEELKRLEEKIKKK